MILSKGTALVALSLTLGGCTNILDLQDPAAVNEAQVWKDSALADAYVNRIYADNLPGWTTGDATTSDESPGGTDQLYGQLTASSVDYWPYGPIRRINILLANIDHGTLDTARTAHMKGEAYFFRAWRYWEMVKRYGGVPLALVAQNLADSLNLPRSPTSVCMAQMLSDLDQAIALLPQISVGAGNDGHVHKGTALALKGRVLLYYASPQFNRPTPDMQRWPAAYDANLAARDYLAAHGFGLYPSFEQLWFVDMNPEAIFVRRYSYPVSTHNWQAATRPLDESQNATGANRPTWQMVQAFPMKNGRPITDSTSSPAYDSVYFWKNRDPRFYATIAYNGAVWELSGKTGRREWTYVGGEINNPTPTGFYTRKAVDPSLDPFGAGNAATQWIEIRYAEVLLNLAEAANAIGHTQEAYDQLKLVRARAGIDPGADGLYGLDAGLAGDQMQAAIMLERRIEFAFEAKRYWDLRRNMRFEPELNGTRRLALKTTLTVPAAQFKLVRDTVNLDSTYQNYFQARVDTLDRLSAINWQSNYYFFGIPQGHIDLNGNIKQSVGWGGTFDPLQ